MVVYTVTEYWCEQVCSEKFDEDETLKKVYGSFEKAYTYVLNKLNTYPKDYSFFICEYDLDSGDKINTHRYDCNGRA